MYIEKLLKRFSIKNSKRRLLPFNHGINFSKDMSPKTNENWQWMRNVAYALVVDELMYVMLCTRPNISYNINFMSKYQVNSREKY